MESQDFRLKEDLDFFVYKTFSTFLAAVVFNVFHLSTVIPRTLHELWPQVIGIVDDNPKLPETLGAESSLIPAESSFVLLSSIVQCPTQNHTDFSHLQSV